MADVRMSVTSENKNIALREGVKFNLCFNNERDRFELAGEIHDKLVVVAMSDGIEHDPIDFLRALAVTETKRGEGAKLLDTAIKIDIEQPFCFGLEWIEQLLSNYVAGEIAAHLDSDDSEEHWFRIRLFVLGKAYTFEFADMSFPGSPEVHWREGRYHIFERTPAT